MSATKPEVRGVIDPGAVRDAWSFAQLDEFWDSYRPLTPYGRDERDRKLVYDDVDAIARSLDSTERALAFAATKASDPAGLDRVSYHLKRMPRLPLEAKERYELVEIFQVKKFLANARAVSRLVDDATLNAFGLEYRLAALSTELDKGGSDAETFFIADAFHPHLPELRAEAAAADERARSLRGATAALIKERFGIDLDGREFVVVPHADARPLVSERGPWILEPYDDESLVVRPAPDAALLDVLAERERIAERERELEDEVIGNLSKLVACHMEETRRLVAALTAFDLAWARARLVAEYGLTRPEFAPPAADGSAPLSVEEGRFPPCERSARSLGLRYEALSARFDEGVTVLFGSNMGGKTVALKTLVFLQLLAQAGFHVPARRFATKVYARLHYVGELAGERLEGLSGFGFEIRRFIDALAMTGDGAFVAFDEFARTTGSHEAEALLSAVVERLSRVPSSRFFFATHFRGVARLSGVSYRRMKGLDHDAASEALDADAPLPARLSGINRHMRYEIVGDDGSPHASDALAVAALLGLDRELVARARAFYDGRG